MARTLQQAEGEIRQLRAENGSLRRQCERLTELVQAKDYELAEVKLQLRDAKQQLQQLVTAIQNLSEQHRALLRRHFASSSERAIADQQYVHELIEAIDPELAQSMTELNHSIQDAELVVIDQDAEEHSDKEISDSNGSEEAEQTVTEAVTTTEADDTTPAASEGSSIPSSRHQRPANSGGRKPLDEQLPRQYELYKPNDDHPALQYVRSYKELGRTVIRRLAIRPVEPYIQEHDCPIYQLDFGGGIKTRQTIAPPAILPKGQVSDALITFSVCAKICDHLPAYRQSKQFARLDLNLSRSKLTRWHISYAEFVEPVAQAVLDEIVVESVIGIDDTVHRILDLLDTERHRCKHGRLWAIQGAVSTHYFFTETREGKWIEEVLGDYHGAIMGDAYQGHKALLRREHIITLFCWAHVRRKFYDADDSLKRQQALALISKLYDIENICRDKPPDQRLALRTQQAKPILAQFKQLLDAWQADPTVLTKSGIGRATTYALNQWNGLITYLDIAAAPIDNNHTERAMRPNALHRKNSLFSASVKGAKAYATLSTLIHSACAHNLNPQTYLDAILEDLHYNRRPIAELTPAAYARRQAKRTTAEQPA